MDSHDRRLAGNQPHRTTIPDPTTHLSAADIENRGAELDVIREQVIASRGERDAAHIRRHRGARSDALQVVTG